MHEPDFDKVVSQFESRKKAFLENLQKMQETINEHNQIFKPVEGLDQKLPNLIQHFQNFVEKLKEKVDKEGSMEEVDTESEESKSEETLIQNEHTVEEELFGEDIEEEGSEAGDLEENDSETGQTDSQESSDDSSDDSSGQDSSDSMEVPVGEPSAEEGGASVPEEVNASEIADSFENGIDEVDNTFENMSFSDEMLEKLRDMQKNFEELQNEQDDHAEELQKLDDGLIQNGQNRKEFADKFMEYINSDEMKEASDKVKDFLNDLKNDFNVQEQ
jgi:predicted transcriptional regulator